MDPMDPRTMGLEPLLRRARLCVRARGGVLVHRSPKPVDLSQRGQVGRLLWAEEAGGEAGRRGEPETTRQDTRWTRMWRP